MSSLPASTRLAPREMSYILERSWLPLIPIEQQHLIELAIILYERERHSPDPLPDYSFIVFPMAKAYEGFLKYFLFNMQLISERTFNGRRFRIGRALNPDIRENQRDKYWLYDDVARSCGDDNARLFWNTWLECRNQVFHYFPSKNKLLSLEASKNRLEMIDDAITTAHHCSIQEV